tara:strand:+ start:1756 stop:1962 length:207 start_codon:yes stop_codon:yes gene_type:complete
MKVYLILIACVQSLNSPLNEVCIAEPLTVPFDTVPQCLAYMDNFKYTLREEKDLFLTGFCSTKNYDVY